MMGQPARSVVSLCVCVSVRFGLWGDRGCWVGRVARVGGSGGQLLWSLGRSSVYDEGPGDGPVDRRPCWSSGREDGIGVSRSLYDPSIVVAVGLAHAEVLCLEAEPALTVRTPSGLRSLRNTCSPSRGSTSQRTGSQTYVRLASSSGPLSAREAVRVGAGGPVHRHVPARPLSRSAVPGVGLGTHHRDRTDGRGQRPLDDGTAEGHRCCPSTASKGGLGHLGEYVSGVPELPAKRVATDPLGEASDNSGSDHCLCKAGQLGHRPSQRHDLSQPGHCNEAARLPTHLHHPQAQTPVRRTIIADAVVLLALSSAAYRLEGS